MIDRPKLLELQTYYRDKAVADIVDALERLKAGDIEKGDAYQVHEMLKSALVRVGRLTMLADLLAETSADPDR